MKVICQDNDGRIVIDGEGVKVPLDRPIPGDSPAVLTNFVFDGCGGQIDLTPCLECSLRCSRGNHD